MGNKPVRGLIGGALAGVGVMLAAGLGPAGAAAGAVVPASAQGGTWGDAQQIPGLAALSQGGSSGLQAVSCGAAGDCSAAGGYTTGAGQGQAFVANEVNGTWGAAQQVRGLGALNKGHSAEINTLSCASAGNCAAGGFYHDSAGKAQAFVVSQVNGVWGAAREVPGTASLNAGGSAGVQSLSCPSAGNCAAGGSYRDGAHTQQAFVVSQVNGVWGSAEEVPGTAAISQVRFVAVDSVSCGAPGNCSAGGSYLDNSGYHPFVTDEVDGTWGTAQVVPGTVALGTSRFSFLAALSCTAPGTCTGGGRAGGHPYVVGETNGTWGTAEVVPGVAAINKGRPAEVLSVSCASPGNCGATGDYIYGTGQTSIFVASQTNGTWGTALELPGIAPLNNVGNALPSGLSCPAPGNCATGGSYQHGSVLHPYVDSLVNGTWHTAREVPGIAALTHASSVLGPVSCVSAGNCSAGGDYDVNTTHQQAFVVTETAARG